MSMTPERIAELTSLLERAGPAEWCAVITPDDADGDTYAYGYGELRTVPTDDGLGWSLLLKVDDHDDQDAVLEFCAEAKNAMRELLEIAMLHQPTGAAR